MRNAPLVQVRANGSMYDRRRPERIRRPDATRSAYDEGFEHGMLVTLAICSAVILLVG